ncbi:hypothetical protein EPYR_03564 [Erwinia pyrifoliae DSM 12163]|nr:hypothetical protein EPYR_03554 [Erwinia pyrifoliae DSM 12163]CAY75944.1 hypothetical protein EPYR_03564 [Erwinia pyrifoliae DSM 12163]
MLLFLFNGFYGEGLCFHGSKKVNSPLALAGVYPR